MTDLEFKKLSDKIVECGLFAKENQSRIKRSYKEDGSVLTETDLIVSETLVSYLKTNFPSCNIITEESEGYSFDDNAPFTFVLDPIDGTDCYSQGFPSWCIALGILDKSLKPAGAIINAPRFGVGSESLLLTTMPGSETVYENGKVLERKEHKAVPYQYAIGSNVLKLVEFPDDFSGKIRSFGSSIIHMLTPVLYSSIDVCIDPPCFVWDVAASYAIVSKLGLKCRYLNSSDFVFTKDFVTGRSKFQSSIVIGYDNACSYVCSRFKDK